VDDPQTVEALVAALAARDELVAATAHRMRTPLTCIMGFATVMNDTWDRLSDDQRKEFAEKIRKYAGDLAAMIDEMVRSTEDPSAVGVACEA
jgi:K+-sensing histidine kinase KdpD